MRTVKEWSEAELDELRKLFSLGLTYQEISRRMKRTENSVASKLRHLGMGRIRRPTFLRYL